MYYKPIKYSLDSKITPCKLLLLCCLYGGYVRSQKVDEGLLPKENTLPLHIVKGLRMPFEVS
jgi:hypothetical protein